MAADDHISMDMGNLRSSNISSHCLSKVWNQIVVVRCFAPEDHIQMTKMGPLDLAAQVMIGWHNFSLRSGRLGLGNCCCSIETIQGAEKVEAPVAKAGACQGLGASISKARS
jgi:hypothetical protein